MSKRASGVALSYLLILVKLVVTLLLTPFLVTSLGIEGYGLYALVGALAAYLYILDFGMNDSVLRFFVAHENDPVERDRFLSKMLGLYAIIGVLVLVVTAGMGMLVEPVFGMRNTSEQVSLLREMILITGGGAAVLIALNPIGALLSATESFVFLRSMEIATTILSAIVMTVVLREGGSAVHIVSVAAAFTVLQSMMRLGYAILVLRSRLHLALPEFKMLRQVGTYAAPIFVVMLAEVMFWRLDSLLIGAILGAAPIAIYSIGVTFNKYFMSFATALSRVMTPEIIRQVDKEVDASVLTDLMIQISRIQAMLLLLILSGLIVFGQRFLELWLGPEFLDSYWIMLLVLVPYAFELTGNARNIVLQVKKLYWYKSLITLSMAVVNIALTVILINKVGVFGAALSTGVVIMMSYVMVAFLLKIKVGMQIGRYWVETSRGIIPVAAVLTALGLYVERFLLEGWAPLVVGGVVYAIIFCILTYCLGANKSERNYIKKYFTRIRLRGG